jgi:copper transport protein
MRSLTTFGALAIALLAAAPTDARAHGGLRASSPAADSVLAAAPTEIRLEFTEAPERAFTRVRLFGPLGEVILPPFDILPGFVVRARIPRELEGGGYRVQWQTAGNDGHPVSGEFAFTVATPAGGEAHMPSAEHMPAAGPARDSDPFAGLGAILRWLTLLGAIAAIGAVAFRLTVLERVSLEIDAEIQTDYLPAAARRAALVGLLAALLLLLSGVARLLLQSAAIHGSDGMMDASMLGPMVAGTSWGIAWMTHMIGAAVAAAGFLLVRRMRSPGWALAAAGCAGIAAGLALSSHAAVLPRLSAVSVAANAVHTVAAAGWLGNLLLVFSVGLPLAWRLERDDRWTVVRDVVSAFSPAALLFAATAALTGIFMAWTHVGSIAALTGSDYGNVLLVKLALLSLTALTGAYNWLRVRPRLGSQMAARHLRRTAGAELAIAALVLAATAVLVALPFPAG